MTNYVTLCILLLCFRPLNNWDSYTSQFTRLVNNNVDAETPMPKKQEEERTEFAHAQFDFNPTQYTTRDLEIPSGYRTYESREDPEAGYMDGFGFYHQQDHEQEEQYQVGRDPYSNVAINLSSFKRKQKQRLDRGLDYPELSHQRQKYRQSYQQRKTKKQSYDPKERLRDYERRMEEQERERQEYYQQQQQQQEQKEREQQQDHYQQQRQYYEQQQQQQQQQQHKQDDYNPKERLRDYEEQMEKDKHEKINHESEQTSYQQHEVYNDPPGKVYENQYQYEYHSQQRQELEEPNPTISALTRQQQLQLKSFKHRHGGTFGNFADKKEQVLFPKLEGEGRIDDTHEGVELVLRGGNGQGYVFPHSEYFDKDGQY